MAMRDSLGKSESGGFRLFPEGTGSFLRQRLRQSFGILLALAGFALFLACLSFNPADPSLNRASDGAVLNLLGRPGAYLADLALQSLGLAVIPAGLLLAAWGWRLLREGALPRAWLRVALTPLVLLTLAMAASVLPEPAGWPLRSGMGGFAGDLLLAHLAGSSGLPGALLAPLAGVAGLLLFLYTVGLRAAEWRASGRVLRDLMTGSLRALGWLARIGTGPLRRKPAADADQAEVVANPREARLRASRERHEPSLVGQTDRGAAAAEPELVVAPRAEVEPLVDYILSGLEGVEHRRDELIAFVEGEFQRQGRAIRITKDSGIVVAQ